MAQCDEAFGTWCCPASTRSPKTKVYRWHRPTRTKLPDDIPETHPDFIGAWAAAEALNGKLPSKTAAGTLAAEVEALLASAAYMGFSPVYRHEVRREADAIRASYISGLREHHMSADLAKLAPRQANTRFKTWRLVCKSAKGRGVIRSDPSMAEVQTYRSRWPIGTVQRACFELVFWTAARTIDAVQIGRQHVGRDGLLIFRQSKTGGMAHVPWMSPLPLWADAWAIERDQMHAAVAHLAGGLTYLQTDHGASRSVKGLGNVISQGGTRSQPGRTQRARTAQSAVDHDRRGGRISPCHHGVGRSQDAVRGAAIHAERGPQTTGFGNRTGPERSKPASRSCKPEEKVSKIR